MSRYFNLTMSVMLAATFVCTLSQAQDSRTAPTRVNTESIRTSNGGALFRAIRPRESVSDYRGGFLHIYPGHNVAQAVTTEGAQNVPVSQGQFVQIQSPETDLLPPLPGNQGGEEVMGIVDPMVDEPVFGNPGVAGIPVDGYYGDSGAVCGPCQNAKFGKGGKSGKGKHGHIGYHDWNWACFCIPMPPEDNFSINFGAHGFTGPLNNGEEGSFGFHEGFNLGAALPGCNLGIGWQIGVQGVHSNESERDQTFFTWGFFRRVDCGLQGGFVFDHMRDDFFDQDESFSLEQARGEISWVTAGCSEFGVFFHASDDSADVDANDDVTVTDVVAAFYRRHFGACRESWGRIYIGGTEGRSWLDGNDATSTSIFGADMHVALSDCWALETGFTWLDATSRRNADRDESWNVGFNVIWMPRGHCCGTSRGYYRPLFNVADNGSFLTHFQ